MKTINVPVRIAQLAWLGLVVVMVPLMSGCGTTKKLLKCDVDVVLDPTLQKGSVQVDLVGVSSNSLPSWLSYSMTDYWKPGDPRRADFKNDRVTLDFTPGKPSTRRLEATNSIWGQWHAKGVTHVLVLADLPGISGDKPGVQDARRQVLPLGERYWAKDVVKSKKLAVVVKQSMIEILSRIQESK